MAEAKYLGAESTAIATQVYDQFIQALIQHHPVSVGLIPDNI